MIIEVVVFSAGFVTADVKVKTNRGTVVMKVGLDLRTNPELDALIPQIEAAINVALEKNLGIVAVGETPEPEPAQASA